MLLDRLISCHDNTIYVQAHLLGFAFDQYTDDFLHDFFCSGYHAQPIVVVASDGENLTRRRVVDFFEDLCQNQIIDRDMVTFVSYDLDWPYNFNHQSLGWHNAFTTLAQHVKVDQIHTVDNNAKFIGCLISRFSPSRLKLAYNLDTAFANDNFITFRCIQGIDGSGKNFYSMVDSTINDIYPAYQYQLEWLKTKKFDQDDTLYDLGLVDGFLPWQQACAVYHMIWPKYQIEIVTETDIFTNSFITEKTAKCLISGKPFMVMSGTGTLHRLKTLGFETYDSVIDETYDQEPTANSRMTAMIDSLKSLYYSEQKQQKIEQLYNIAKHNQKLYAKICKQI